MYIVPKKLFKITTFTNKLSKAKLALIKEVRHSASKNKPRSAYCFYHKQIYYVKYQNLKLIARDRAIKRDWENTELGDKELYYKLSEADRERHTQNTIGKPKRTYVKRKEWPQDAPTKGQYWKKRTKRGKKMVEYE